MSSHVLKPGFSSITQNQSINWCTEIPICPRLKKWRMSKSKLKTMLIVFLISMVLSYWMSTCESDPQYYRGVLIKLVARVTKAIMKKLKYNSWMVYQVIAPVHKEISAKQFSAKDRTHVLEHLYIYINHPRYYKVDVPIYLSSLKAFGRIKVTRKHITRVKVGIKYSSSPLV